LHSSRLSSFLSALVTSLSIEELVPMTINVSSAPTTCESRLKESASKESPEQVIRVKFFLVLVLLSIPLLEVLFASVLIIEFALFRIT
jgi:hypothetical protein